MELSFPSASSDSETAALLHIRLVGRYNHQLHSTEEQYCPKKSFWMSLSHSTMCRIKVLVVKTKSIISSILKPKLFYLLLSSTARRSSAREYSLLHSVFVWSPRGFVSQIGNKSTREQIPQHILLNLSESNFYLSGRSSSVTWTDYEEMHHLELLQHNQTTGT